MEIKYYLKLTAMRKNSGDTLDDSRLSEEFEMDLDDEIDERKVERDSIFDKKQGNSCKVMNKTNPIDEYPTSIRKNRTFAESFANTRKFQSSAL